jgi:NAD(P)-dependent dehydrogenase (short-subunit alcohol dehydrogenase family)
MANVNIDKGSKAVLITGAASGIGLGCALYLDELGYKVFAGVRREDEAMELKQKASNRLAVIKLDVTDNFSITDAFIQIQAQTGQHGLWALINNAGVSSNGPLEFYPLEEVRRIFEVNLFGLMAVTQAFLPLLRTGKGRIINISSVSAMMAFPFSGPYCASKYGVEVFSNSLRMELTPWSIPVSVIEPASISSGMWSKSRQSTETILYGLPEKGKEYYGAALIRLNELNSGQGSNTDSPLRIAKLVSGILMSRKPRRMYREGKAAGFLRIMQLLPSVFRDKMLLYPFKKVFLERKNIKKSQIIS